MVKTKKPYHVHFVCRGNVHRSRMAEAYMKLLDLPNFVFSSSGVAALQYSEHYKSPITAITLDAHPELKRHMNQTRNQTTETLLKDADVVICLDRSVFDDATREFGLDPRKALPWHVEDIDRRVKRAGKQMDDHNAVKTAELDIFSKIHNECNKLATYLTHTAWVDVVDAQNVPVGLRLPMAWVTDRGLWHRGVHIVARTVDGKYVVEKRSSKIVFSPGMLDISLGGGVDSGEHPLQAAMRETSEELGIHIPEKQFRAQFMYKKVGYHPHYKKETKCHVYSYSVKLPVHSKELRPQRDEVAEILALNHKQVKRLLRKHRLRHFGQLSWSYKFYNKVVEYSTLP